MDARIQDLPFDPAALHRLSPALITSHHRNNYGGAVKRLNAIRAQLADMAFAAAPGFQLNGVKREELIATNSMLLHELYFGSLGGDGVTMEPACKLALDANFGSVERWREEFVACAKALGGGSGWVLLVFQPREGTLVNQWAADHTHAVAGGVPILALDMYEHAYHLGGARGQRALRRRPRRARRLGAARRAPGRRVRAGAHDDPRRALARPRRGRGLVR